MFGAMVPTPRRAVVAMRILKQKKVRELQEKEVSGQDAGGEGSGEGGDQEGGGSEGEGGGVDLGQTMVLIPRMSGPHWPNHIPWLTSEVANKIRPPAKI